jgi:hypothetical protein
MILSLIRMNFGLALAFGLVFGKDMAFRRFQWCIHHVHIHAQVRMEGLEYQQLCLVPLHSTLFNEELHLTMLSRGNLCFLRSYVLLIN